MFCPIKLIVILFLILDRPPHHDGMRMTHMWPFRYFGFHTDMQDILGKPIRFIATRRCLFMTNHPIFDVVDIDDRIYPRARSRIGPRYQAEPIDEFTTEPPSRHATPTTTSSPPPSSLRAATANKGRAKRVEKRGRPRKKRTGNTRIHSIIYYSKFNANDLFIVEASPDIPDDDIQEGPVERGTDATVTPLFSQPSRLDEATCNLLLLLLKMIVI